MFSSAVFVMVTIVQVRYWCRPSVTIAKGERVGGQVKLPESSIPKGGVGPDCVACFFCLSRQQHYLLTVQTIPFGPNPSHSATDGQSGFLGPGPLIFRY